ncbi:MAG: NADPH-dependent glutamate synthase [Firmicutes bacterium]|nr:NADPH-dependent glutamate synthase [Bacillota bacterium]
MINLSLKKNEMPLQDPKERINNFDEVSLGYSLEQAIDEAKRCLACKHKPCVKGCPVEIDIPRFIQKITQGEIEEAYQIIGESSSLPSVCGRVCPQETQCEELCVRAIKGESVAIGRLERFVADYHHNNKHLLIEHVQSNNHKIAVVGSGPSGISCAYDLAQLGYKVTMFEALHIPGGVLVYGIPEFRLPKEIVRTEIKTLQDLGVEIETNVIIGKTLSIEDLFEDGFEAVFIGTGAGLPKFMNIPGEMLNGVYSANEFLTRVNLMKAYHQSSATPIQMAKRVAVIGGGNVAVDAARCAKRLGAEEVSIVYRRSMKELPARLEEIEHAEEEGIIFKLLTNPVQIIGDEKGYVQSIECVQMELGEPDSSGRRRPLIKKDSNFIIEVESVIMAIGTTPNPLITSTTKGLDTNSSGCIITKDDSGKTSREMVFAGGDVVTGAATVILAMGAGRKSAHAIDMKIRSLNQK